MRALINIEWLKIKKYPAFWWMLAIVALTYPGVNLIGFNIYEDVTKSKEMMAAIAKMLLGNPFAFPETWHTIAYFSSFFILLPAILVIMLMTNEYQFRTHRQNIIDGWSRNQFMASKLIDVAIIAGVVTLIYVLVALGFALSIDSSSISRSFNQLYYIPLFYLQCFAQLTIAFLLAFLLRKAFLALGLFLFYSIILENIAVGYFKYKKWSIREFLPLEISDRILVPPAFIGNFGKDAKNMYQESIDAVPLHVGLTIALTAFIWWLCFRLYNRKDLS